MSSAALAQWGLSRAAAQGLQRRRHQQVLRDEAPAL